MIADPEFESHVSFIEEFHGGFENTLEGYVGDDRRVFVFIDDLDRCTTPKAAELMQSIHLMIADDRGDGFRDGRGVRPGLHHR